MRFKITQINQPLYMSEISEIEAATPKEAVAKWLFRGTAIVTEFDYIGHDTHAAETDEGDKMLIERIG